VARIDDRWHEFFEPAGSLVRAASKETKMKRTISLWLGLLAFAFLPAFAQTPAATAAASAPKGSTGKIHGHVINPTGASQTNGTVSLSTDGGHTSKYTFPVSSTGEYAGDAAPGTYTLVFRQPDTPSDKMIDSIDSVKIVAGQDLLQDDDMSRKAFVDKLPAEQQKQLEEYKKKNSEAMKANEVIKNINADIRVAMQDFTDASNARNTAIQTLGATASKADLDAKEKEIEAAKYGEVETLMLKDTAARPDATTLWVQLGQAQAGLARAQNDPKKYDEAEAAYKKALEEEAASKKPNPQVQGAANAGLGEIHARTGKVAEASAAYDAAAKANPSSAEIYLKNEAVIFYQMNNAEAQVAAADKAIQVDPNQPILYYLKGQGLVQNATIDAKTQRIVLPPGCADAFQKYLELAPTGPYAADAKGILEQAGEKLVTSYTAGKSKK
jgi:tetratricopeptide (TPR) repeat protein